MKCLVYGWQILDLEVHEALKRLFSSIRSEEELKSVHLQKPVPKSFENFPSGGLMKDLGSLSDQSGPSLLLSVQTSPFACVSHSSTFSRFVFIMFAHETF